MPSNSRWNGRASPNRSRRMILIARSVPTGVSREPDFAVGALADDMEKVVVGERRWREIRDRVVRPFGPWGWRGRAGFHASGMLPEPLERSKRGRQTDKRIGADQ